MCLLCVCLFSLSGLAMFEGRLVEINAEIEAKAQLSFKTRQEIMAQLKATAVPDPVSGLCPLRYKELSCCGVMC
jgi:hypothetical protein